MARLPITIFIITTLTACDLPDEPNGKANTQAASITDTVLSQLETVMAGKWRDPANVARDKWRHPAQTLSFFGVNPDQTIVEIIPGNGWYTELLAPFLRKKGHYIAAVIDPDSAINETSKSYYAKQIKILKIKLIASPKIYGAPEVRRFDEGEPVFGKPCSASMVLTFRNVHNWLGSGTVELMFQGFFDVLKPGGVLGIVEHRAMGDVTSENASGYISQNQVIAWANAVGFVLEGSSEINANPNDTKDHDGGVWRLSPAFSLGNKNRDKYAAIGESDRMTLLFRKPVNAAR